MRAMRSGLKLLLLRLLGDFLLLLLQSHKVLACRHDVLMS